MNVEMENFLIILEKKKDSTKPHIFKITKI